MPKVRFEREDMVIDAKPGQTLLEICEQADIDVFRGIWTGMHCKRVHGWCNRCKVWVKPDRPDAINPPTSAERFPLRFNGRIGGTMRLACQVEIQSDVSVHTRAGGPAVLPNVNWEATSEPTRWKERWEKRHEKGAADAEDDAASAAE